MIERQIEYVRAMLAGLAEQKAKSASIKPEAQARFIAKLQEDLGRTVWAYSSCTSWYKNEKGQITQNWGSNCTAYAEAVNTVIWEDYQVC